ncbi:DEAD/DEAH box helicase [Aeoliella sp.]|uniref:DEAD/DEAH box helicase n=1 Tax=Aeoliella sp. TaxID=2795800 RepID=UPI003CCC048B
MPRPLESTTPLAEVALSMANLASGAGEFRVASTHLLGALAEAVSLPLEFEKVKVKSFHFAPRDEEPAGERPSRPRPRPKRAKHTRIRAPRDVVRLEDRLSYVLQPPLETLLADELVELPFTPFDYQLDGIAFLFPRNHAVLADEMGLGKTMQAVTTTRLLVRSKQARRVLLVCPKPLVTNWQREFALWAPEIPVTVISGPGARREFLWRQRAVVSLVNYETLVRDEAIVEEQDLNFDLVVLDESQRIKNRSGTTNRVVRNLVRERSWALTGTPIENSVDDLVGIFDFVSPGSLRTGMKPREMGRAVSDVVLRRTKDTVMQDMPPKLVRDSQIDLTPEQWDSYQRAENDGVVELGELGEEITLQHVFQLVLRLKQICNFDPATGESSKRDQLAAELEEVAASGQKAIVFSQWVDTIEKLGESLAQFHPVQYHGKVPHGRRDSVLQQFRKDPQCSVILMSYGAGAVGLNLQFASYVFLFDRWWNPAVEDQAINRAHRIGCAGPVTVTRFLAAGTIEQRIDQILAEKRELFDAVFSEGRSPRNLSLSREELFSLFDLSTPEGRMKAA